MYSAMIGLSISFMVLGVILAITAVFVFFKKNMAQVYDALLDRGYQERLRHHKHTAAPAPATPSGPAVQPRQVQPRTVPTGRAASPAGDHSGNTMPLDQNATGNGVKAPAEHSGQTTLLQADAQADSQIMKSLRYAYSKEIIE